MDQRNSIVIATTLIHGIKLTSTPPPLRDFSGPPQPLIVSITSRPIIRHLLAPPQFQPLQPLRLFFRSATPHILVVQSLTARTFK